MNLTVFHTRRSVAARVSLEADELRRNLQQALDRRVQAERETQEAADKVSRPCATGAGAKHQSCSAPSDI